MYPLRSGSSSCFDLEIICGKLRFSNCLQSPLATAAAAALQAPSSDFRPLCVEFELRGHVVRLKNCTNAIDAFWHKACCKLVSQSKSKQTPLLDTSARYYM